MDITNKNKKQYIFVGGEKVKRKKRDLTKKPMFLVQKTKLSELASPGQIYSNTKSKEIEDNNTSSNKTVKKRYNSCSADINICCISSPISFIVKANINDAILGKFVLNYFSTPSMEMNHYKVTQLIGLINPWEKNIMARMLSNRKVMNLKYFFEQPIYRGPAIECTNIGVNEYVFTSDKLTNIQNSLTPLESHLIYLFLKYTYLFNSSMIESYFEYRLKHDWHEIDFQSLLAIVLCIASPYLAIEPYEYPINISHLSGYYFERSRSLFNMIKGDSLPIKTCKVMIIAHNLCINYTNWTDEANQAHRMMQTMNWDIIYTQSTEEILKTRPDLNTRKFYIWEQGLFIWCVLNYYASVSLFVGVAIEGLDQDKCIPNILPALEALYHSKTNCKLWKNSYEGHLRYLLFKSQPILERARLFARKAFKSYNPKASPTLSDLEQMYYIKQLNNDWKNEFTEYFEGCKLTQDKLAATTTLYLFYHFFTIITILPYLPSTPNELKDPIKFKIFVEFILSSTSVTLLMECQGTYMIIMGNGTKDVILSIVLSGVKLCLEILDQLGESAIPSTAMIIKNLTSVLNILLVSKIKTCWGFKFQKKLNSAVTQRRCLLLWLNIRNDDILKNLSLGNRSTSTCDQYQPKLDNFSKLKILN